MVFWMVMEPNIVPVVRLPNGDTYLVMDLYNIYDEGEFTDILTGTFNPPSGFKQFQEQYKGIFTHSDIMNFLNFHNHKLSDSHNDMISYVMAKFKNHYVNFLKGDINSKLFDLR